MDDHLLQHSLAGCSLHHVLVNCVGRHKTIYHNWFVLANPVTPVLSLEISLRVLQSTECAASVYAPLQEH